ncbi:10487_t:CDS:2, partial [Racocetra persica]
HPNSYCPIVTCKICEEKVYISKNCPNKPSTTKEMKNYWKQEEPEKQPLLSPRIEKGWQLTCKHCFQDYYQEYLYYNLFELPKLIRKNNHFTLNDFEVINPDNVKKHYDKILLCKTCYHIQFEELKIDDPKVAGYYKKEEINKLTECNFYCKPIIKRQGYQLWNTRQYMCCLEEMIVFMVYTEITDRPIYHTHQRIYHRTRYGMHASKSINESKIYRLINLIKEEE